MNDEDHGSEHRDDGSYLTTVEEGSDEGSQSGGDD
jgi:hypothetical protein